MKPDSSPRDPDGTRGRILDAALEKFAGQGYHDTRMDEIVARSGTSKGAIYFHFPEQGAALPCAGRPVCGPAGTSRAQRNCTEEVGMRRVQAALHACLDTFGKYRRPAKLLLVQAVGLGSTFEQKRLEVNDRFTGLIRGWLDEAVAVGDIETSRYGCSRLRLDGGHLRRGHPLGLHRRARLAAHPVRLVAGPAQERGL